MRARRRRTAGDRGAGLVEYALGAALVLVAIVAGLQWVQSAGESALDRQADNIDYSSNGGGAPSTTSSSTTTTSSSTTTASTTTTTTAPTTTTTTAPTTTTTSPTAAMTDLVVASATPSVQWWNGKDGAWLDGITFDYRWRNGATITLSITRTYGNNQSVTSTESVQIQSGKYAPYLTPNAMAKAASSNVVSVKVTVVKIQTQDANWQQQTFTVSAPSVTITAPNP